ncbi:MAG: DUF4349 domain-containing protein [Actinomycetota bacterium]
MNRRWLIVAALASLIGLAGCTHSSRSPSKTLEGGAVKGAPPAVVGDVGRPAQAAPARPVPAHSAVQQRAFVQTATVGLRVEQVDAAADQAAKAAERAGGRVDGDARGGGGSAHLVLRVPSAALDSMITALDALGAETSRTIEGTDVTAQQADINARIAATATSVARLQSLLARSANLSDLLALENQLTQRQSDLESMQAQQRALADQVALASITVDISGPPSVAHRAAGGPTGFGGAIAAGWDGVVLAGRWVAAVVGYALPILGLAAIVILAGRPVARRYARRPRKAAL